MKPTRRAVGIDLGTTHTVVAFADLDGEAPTQIFPVHQLVTPTLREARPLFPSCLYAPVPGEISEEALALFGVFGDARWVAGELARRRGGEVPGRLVASAKSWLCHPGVDRDAPILPWGSGASDEPGGPPRISPVDASARYLAHVARAWDEAFPGEPLAAAEVVLTVPASFDEVARELTVTAARRTGLSVRLLEEPQAAFYDYMEREGRAGLDSLLASSAGVGATGNDGSDGRDGREAVVLVVDIGGGTTDLSLLRVARGQGGDGDGAIEVTRIAVGRHLLLGGDNMDLALAHLCEARLVAPPARLDPGRFGQLVVACRAAKERLLGGASEVHEGNDGDAGNEGTRTARAAEAAPITILGAGARLVGSALTTELTRADVLQVVLDGFFPREGREARPSRAMGVRSGLVAFGLPYERDVAVTRHVAQFFARHAEGAGPNALLLNGGVFRAHRLAARLESVIADWGGPAPLRLPLADPDLAVARGAVAYARARQGRGLRIRGGAARGYYIGLDVGEGTEARRAVCVVPRGAEEGTVHTSAGVTDSETAAGIAPAEGDGRQARTFGLVVGRPVRFDLFASDEAQHLPGEIVAIDEERFTALPPVAVAFEASAGRGKGKPEEVRVALEGELSPIGTLDFACVEVSPPASSPAQPREARRRFRLAFQIRHEAASADASAAVDIAAGGKARAPSPRGRGDGAAPAGRLDEAREAILRVYGKGRPDVTPREVKDLLRELERLLGDRAGWTLATNRALFDALAPGHRSRRRSADHERVFWLLAGYTGRPGFGDPEDARRVAEISPLFGEKVVFPDEPRGAQQFWIAWRRLTGGLDEAAQTRIRDVLDPLLAPSSARLKKPKGWKLEAEWDALELAAGLERLPPARRSELGAWILERTWTSRDPRLWSALGRIGARVPAYASVHHVIQPLVVERWLDHLLREKWETLASAPEAAIHLARVTGDRARDVSERTRFEVAARLEAAGARAERVRAVREFVAEAEAERAARFGEGLPVGLRLIA
jgi:DNA-K related protein/Hsp70 protein